MVLYLIAVFANKKTTRRHTRCVAGVVSVLGQSNSVSITQRKDNRKIPDGYKTLFGVDPHVYDHYSS